MMMALGRDAISGLDWNGDGVGEDDEMMITMERDSSERLDA